MIIWIIIAFIAAASAAKQIQIGESKGGTVGGRRDVAVLCMRALVIFGKFPLMSNNRWDQLRWNGQRCIADRGALIATEFRPTVLEPNLPKIVPIADVNNNSL